MKKNWLSFMTGVSAILMAFPVYAQQINFEKEEKAVVEHFRFAGNHREESMWSALDEQ